MAFEEGTAVDLEQISEHKPPFLATALSSLAYKSRYRKDRMSENNTKT